MSFDLLPKVMIQYISSFLGLRSLVSFSQINKKTRKIFPFITKFFNLVLDSFPEDESYEESHSFYINRSNLFLGNLLHFECKNKKISIEMIKYLLQNKVDVNFVNLDNSIPLQNACKNKNSSVEILKTLIDNNSDINSVNYIKETPFHSLLKNDHVLCFDILKYFIEKKSFININNECTPLHLLCNKRNPSIDCIKYLGLYFFLIFLKFF
jgi:ankyrin repeat protein